MDVNEGSSTPSKAGKKEWLGLAVLALPTLLLSLDLSVLYLALPQLSGDLRADSTEQLWIMDIYGFLIAGFLVTMGTLGDRIGRRKLLLIGGVIFGITSVCAAYSSSPEMLIALRAVMGIAGATLMPSTLGLISNMFHDPQQRGFAIAAWMSCFMGGMTIGPIIGGVLLESFWWGSAFLLGAPVMVLLVICGPLLLPEFKDPNPRRLDLVSVAMSLTAILPVIWGLKELAKNGVSPLALVSMAVGLAFGFAFVKRQSRVANPLIDLTLFHNRSFNVALAIMLSTALTMGGVFLLVSQALQVVQNLSPLDAGLALLPPAVVMTVMSLSAPALAQRLGKRVVISGGLFLCAIGFLAITQVTDASTFALMSAFTIVNVGMGVSAPLISDLIVGSAPPERAGSAASIQETSGEFGIAVGVATIGSLGAAVCRSQLSDNLPAGLPAGAVDMANESVAAAVTLGEAIAEPARDAFMAGIGAASIGGIVVCLASSVLAAVVLRHRQVDVDVDVTETESEANKQSAIGDTSVGVSAEA